MEADLVTLSRAEGKYLANSIIKAWLYNFSRTFLPASVVTSSTLNDENE